MLNCSVGLLLTVLLKCWTVNDNKTSYWSVQSLYRICNLSKKVWLNVINVLDETKSTLQWHYVIKEQAFMFSKVFFCHVFHFRQTVVIDYQNQREGWGCVQSVGLAYGSESAGCLRHSTEDTVNPRTDSTQQVTRVCCLLTLQKCQFCSCKIVDDRAKQPKNKKTTKLCFSSPLRPGLLTPELDKGLDLRVGFKSVTYFLFRLFTMMLYIYRKL